MQIWHYPIKYTEIINRFL